MKINIVLKKKANQRKEAQNAKSPTCEGWAFLYSGSPTWTRTRDLRINSPSLYRLSYQGKEAALYRPFLGLARASPKNFRTNL